MNFALYAPTAPQTLFSLGHLHSCNGTYLTGSDPNRLTISANGVTLDTATLRPHANLYHASIQSITTALRYHTFLTSPPTLPPTANLFPPPLHRFIKQHPPSATPSSNLSAFPGVVSTDTIEIRGRDPPSTALPSKPALSLDTPSLLPVLPSIHLKRITAAQYARVIDAIELHNTQNHPPDAKLCTELSTGKHPYSSLTPVDINLMRQLVGPCPLCPEGRAFKPAASKPLSTTAPATFPGETISFDTHKLPANVLGGFTHMITMVDEHTGHIDQPGLPTKKVDAAFDGIRGVIQRTFNAHGHKVVTLHGDAERVNTALTPLLGAIGTKLKVSLPGHHAHRVERTVQTIAARARSVAAGLPYHLPPETTLLLKQSVGETLNNSICKASSPLTPNEAISGFKPQRPPIAFGRCAMVTQPEDKRRALSALTKTPYNLIPVTELGVSMGLQPGTDRTQWLLANGKVVPRIPIGPVLPTHHVPFNWKPKSVNSVQLHPHLQLIFTRPTTATTNIPIQHPDKPIPLSSDFGDTTTTTTPRSSPELIPLPSPSSSELNSTGPITPSSHHRTLPEESIPPLPLSSLPAPLPAPPQPEVVPVTFAIPHPPLNPHIPTIAPSFGLPVINIPTITNHHMTTRSRSTTKPTERSPYGGLGAYGSLLKPLTGHQLRKRQLLQTAALRDRTYRLLHPTPAFLNNRPTELRPTPPERQQNEFSVRQALHHLDPLKVQLAITKETTKIFPTYHSLKVIQPHEVEAGANFIPNKLILREKTNKDVTARIAMCGDRQRPHTYGETHAGTSDSTHRAFSLACGIAHSSHHKLKLITFNFDVPAAFINKNKLPRSLTGGTQLITRTPSVLPPPYDDKLCEIIGAHYGLKQANNIYDQDFIQLMVKDGFTPCASHPYTFVKWSIPGLHEPPSHHIIVSMHVDDGDGNTTSTELYDAFQKLIITRYGQLTFNSPSQGTCGQVQVVNSDGSITLHWGPYIRKMLHRIGMDAVPAALSPDIKGLFDPSENLTKLNPLRRAEFRTVNGELIHLLARHDIKKVVTWLLTRGESPDESDYLKQFQLLRYLKGTPDLGPTFSSNPLDYPNGVEIHSSCDCAHNVHPGGQSHSASTHTVGCPFANTAPFLSYSAAEKGISLSPCEGEYVTASKTAKPLVHFRQFARDLGFPQDSPSTMLQDNASSINLTTAPLIPSKSRHIALKHHHIRWLHKLKEIKPVHQGTNDVIPDALTKHVGPSRFLYFRQKVFQTPSILPLP